MTAPNVQRVVDNKLLIIVALAGNGPEAFLTVGPVGNPSHPAKISLKPFLDSGSDVREALERAADIAEVAVRGTMSRTQI
jgi:hypothetical protein